MKFKQGGVSKAEGRGGSKATQAALERTMGLDVLDVANGNFDKGYRDELKRSFNIGTWNDAIARIISEAQRQLRRQIEIAEQEAWDEHIHMLIIEASDVCPSNGIVVADVINKVIIYKNIASVIIKHGDGAVLINTQTGARHMLNLHDILLGAEIITIAQAFGTEIPAGFYARELIGGYTSGELSITVDLMEFNTHRVGGDMRFEVDRNMYSKEYTFQTSASTALGRDVDRLVWFAELAVKVRAFMIAYIGGLS